MRKLAARQRQEWGWTDYGADHHSCGIMLLTCRQHILSHSVTGIWIDTITFLESLPASQIRTHFNSLQRFPSEFLLLCLSLLCCFIRSLGRFKKDGKLCRGLPQLLYRLGISHLLAHVQEYSGGGVA